jgi:hypothetical protein
MKSPSSSPNKPGAADPKFLKIVYRLIRELKTNPINPRLHSQKQIRQMVCHLGSTGVGPSRARGTMLSLQ